MADSARPAATDSPSVIIVSACSHAFFEFYLDLLDSLDEAGIRRGVTIGLLDLGLAPQQAEMLESRGVHRILPRWPFEPPARFSGLEFFGFAAKPFLRELFPGFEVYVWLDADMWVQTPAFWRPLIDNAVAGRFATAIEADEAYERPSLRYQLWLLANGRRGFGLPAALRLAAAPVINNSLAALRHDAPHWGPWQFDFERLVRRSNRLIGMDQIALASVLFRRRLPAALLPATTNWVCSRALPNWDRVRQRFVAPSGFGSAAPERTISILHLTTPSRGKAFEVPDTDGGRARRFLHRPGGHVARKVETRVTAEGIAAEEGAAGWSALAR